ncbi:unnamed protein product, partial [Symbiodinium microadriaticum]
FTGAGGGFEGAAGGATAGEMRRGEVSPGTLESGGAAGEGERDNLPVANPFHSERVRTEVELIRSRPSTLDAEAARLGMEVNETALGDLGLQAGEQEPDYSASFAAEEPPRVARVEPSSELDRGLVAGAPVGDDSRELIPAEGDRIQRMESLLEQAPEEKRQRTAAVTGETKGKGKGLDSPEELAEWALRQRSHWRSSFPEVHSASFDIAGPFVPGDGLEGCSEYEPSECGVEPVDPIEVGLDSSLDELLSLPEGEATEKAVTHRVRRKRPEDGSPGDGPLREPPPEVSGESSAVKLGKTKTVFLGVPLRSKRGKEVYVQVQGLINKLEAFGLPVHRYHADRAKELRSTALIHWLKGQGIHPSWTAGESPAGNRAELAVQNLKGFVRKLLVISGLDKGFWPLALLHASSRNYRNFAEHLGVPQPVLLPFGVKVHARQRVKTGYDAQWRPRTIQGCYVGEAPSTPGGHLVLIKDGLRDKVLLTNTIYPLRGETLGPPLKPWYRLTTKRSPVDLAVRVVAASEIASGGSRFAPGGESSCGSYGDGVFENGVFENGDSDYNGSEDELVEVGREGGGEFVESDFTVRLPSGEQRVGHVYDIKNDPVVFCGKRWHVAEPWEGEVRWVISAFVPRDFYEPMINHWDVLGELGFPVEGVALKGKSEGREPDIVLETEACAIKGCLGNAEADWEVGLPLPVLDEVAREGWVFWHEGLARLCRLLSAELCGAVESSEEVAETAALLHGAERWCLWLEQWLGAWADSGGFGGTVKALQVEIPLNDQEKPSDQFLQTRTISLQEARKELNLWREPASDEVLSLESTNRAVDRVKSEVVEDWVAQGVTVIQLPGKAVLTRKSGTGKRRTWGGFTIDVKSAFLYAPIGAEGYHGCSAMGLNTYETGYSIRGFQDGPTGIEFLFDIGPCFAGHGGLAIPRTRILQLLALINVKTQEVNAETVKEDSHPAEFVYTAVKGSFKEGRTGEEVTLWLKGQAFTTTVGCGVCFCLLLLFSANIQKRGC